MTLNKASILYKTLARALSMKRPHNSEGTIRLTQWLEDHVPRHAKVKRDAAGNLHVDTRRAETNRTLFVAHVDTVHHDQGPNKIDKSETKWCAAGGVPLGADDGAGVAMLMHLLHSDIHGYFVFTQGEECGGIGARWLANNMPDLLGEFDRAIAFDRRGIDSVITHQSRGRCCSDTFADALSAALNADDTLMYLPDDTGVYTDTAEFTLFIPECTNISVGYMHEHSDRESLDITHLVALAARAAAIDWDGLPTERDPLAVEPNDSWWLGDWQGSKATSVRSSSSFADRWHLLSDDVDLEEGLREELVDSIYDAMSGQRSWLIEMLCESVWPEDPDTARLFIDPNKLDEDLLEQALRDSKVYDPDVVMAAMYDQIYRDR